MKALSILQPWAWAILNAGKDIENRGWKDTNPGLRFRGRFLIHTGLGFDLDGYDHLRDTLDNKLVGGWPVRPDKGFFRRGGIVGSAEIVDCVTEHPSRWFFGRYGFVLKNAQPLAGGVLMIPLKGQLGFFEVPKEISREALYEAAP